MNAREACDLLVDVVRELSATRAERDSWCLVALAMSGHVAELTRELEMTDARQYVARTRSQDVRDLFLDQVNMRRESQAA